jgi:hypothetical protein
MRALKAFSLSLLFILVIILTCFYLVADGAKITILDADYYQSLFDNTALVPEISEQLIAVFQNEFKTQATEKAEQGLGELSPATLTLIDLTSSTFWSLLDTAWLEAQLILVIDDTLAYVKGEKDNLTAVINMVEDEKKLRSELIKAIRRLPRDQREMLGGHPAIIEARAVGIIRELGLLEGMSMAEIQASGNLPDGINEAATVYQEFQAYFFFLPFAALTLLILMILLANLSGGFKWFGAALVISAGLYYLALNAAGNVAPVFISGELINYKLSIPLETIRETVSFTIGIISGRAKLIAVAGLFILLIGFIIGLLSRKKDSEKVAD